MSNCRGINISSSARTVPANSANRPARLGPNRPSPMRSISVQSRSNSSSGAPSSANGGASARRPLTAVTNNSSSSRLSSSKANGGGIGGSLAAPQAFNRSVSADPSLLNDPSVQAKIGNRATKVVQKSIGKCGTCNKSIQEDGCTAFGKVYHKACFKCFTCKQKIQGKFFERAGKPYCEKDYQNVKGVLQPTCFTCKKKITGDKSIEAIGKIYHVTCLVCEVCKAPLKGDFYLKGDKLVCKKELRKLLDNCTVCNMPIKGDCVESNNKVFHPGCMKCYICGDSLKGVYFTYEDKPICEKDYKQQAESCAGCGEPPIGKCYSYNGQVFCEQCHEKECDRCPKCEKEVAGKCVRVSGAAYHPDCFTCVVCKKNMINVPFVADDKQQIYCTDDYNRKKAPRCSFCKKPIVPKDGQKTAPRLRALGKDFHPDCFQCEDCGMVLDARVKGKECYPFKNRLYCLKCNRKKLSSEEESDSDDEN